MPSPILQSERLILRTPKAEDAISYQEAGRDLAIARLYGSTTDSSTITASEAAKWLEGISTIPYSWMIESEGKAIGHARFHSMVMEEKRVNYAIGMFQSAHTGQGLGTEATRLICAYGFDTLGLHRIALRVAAFNQRAIRSYQKVGFKEEGCERECFLMDGKWQDDVIMGCLTSEFRAH